MTTGNPNLDPYRANAYDLSGEWYFAKGALLSVALFYKDIKSLVQIVRQTGDFSATRPGCRTASRLRRAAANTDPTACLAGWQFNVPRNSPGGNLKGVEVNYQQPFTFLPAPLDKFGTVLNYTGVKSSIDYFVTAAGDADDQRGPDPALEERVQCDAVLRERDDSACALSAAYRGPYLTTVPARNMIVSRRRARATALSKAPTRR